MFPRIIVKIFLHFSLQESKQHFLLHVYCDLPSFNTALKIHQIQTAWVTCFPPSARRPIASSDAVVWGCPFLFFSLYYTFVCTKHCLVFPWLRNTPFYIVSGRIVDRVEKIAGHEFGLKISLWKCELAYYENLNVNSAVKGHKDTTKICELQAASWCRISIGAPLKAKLHTYWAHISFDIRPRWHGHFCWAVSKKIISDVWCPCLHTLH